MQRIQYFFFQFGQTSDVVPSDIWNFWGTQRISIRRRHVLCNPWTIVDKILRIINAINLLTQSFIKMCFLQSPIRIVLSFQITNPSQFENSYEDALMQTKERHIYLNLL